MANRKSQTVEQDDGGVMTVQQAYGHQATGERILIEEVRLLREAVDRLTAATLIAPWEKPSAVVLQRSLQRLEGLHEG